MSKAREKFLRRYRRDRAADMGAVDFLQWIDRLPREEFYAIPFHAAEAKRAVKKAIKRKAPTRFKPVPSGELCKRLIGIAAFSCQGNPKATEAIYRTVRILQLMDALAPAVVFPDHSSTNMSAKP